MDPQLAAVIVWPVVALIVAIWALFLFRVELRSLINRTKKIGKGGIEAFEDQPPVPSEEKKGVEEFLRSFDSPLLLEAEQLVVADLKARHIETPADKEKALVRSLAASNLILHFERSFGTLWASQVAVLKYLNPRENGADITEIVPFYDLAKSNYPTWYENYPFDKWFGFVKSLNLVNQKDSVVFITVAGREFLKYLVATGKAGPFNG